MTCRAPHDPFLLNPTTASMTLTTFIICSSTRWESSALPTGCCGIHSNGDTVLLLGCWGGLKRMRMRTCQLQQFVLWAHSPRVRAYPSQEPYPFSIYGQLTHTGRQGPCQVSTTATPDLRHTSSGLHTRSKVHDMGLASQNAP